MTTDELKALLAETTPIRYKPVGYDQGMEPAHDGPYILAAEHDRIVAEKDNAIKAARREAFEEAAKMADELFYPDETKISARIRDAIRALAEKE